MSRNGYAKLTDVIVTIPVSKELHLKLKVHAAKQGKSIKAVLTQAIEEMIG